ncbi:MAG TPA: tRNA uridine-5-carboxymethylaminomethyl(34) synthesis GTPase MnmE [Tissierellales bacterium]|nr:tRNA uridine-5-carboxymethylaminomethyl(34) synthesis GTPase MnmE [Tissierellales bacterium]
MSDTIAAISSAVGEAGIGIVRMSGPKSSEIVKKIFKRKNNKKIENIENRKLNYGYIIRPEDSKIVDEVLMVYMEAPHTYTREDIVEIYCHGGIISVTNILEIILNNDARLADAGEFTKRAFLNGRLDLSQAEAVIDIIKAKTNKSYELSLNQLEGGLSSKIQDIQNVLLDMIAHVEVSIDFSDEDIEEVTYEELDEKANIVLGDIEQLISTADKGKILREGLNTVILGKPNVGKSSFLNSILRENRAIVTDIPGTTRDIIEEYANIDGIPLKLIDTAGIRYTEDLVEKMGVDRAKKEVERADLIIAIFDSSVELSKEDYDILEIVKDKNAIILLNKTDLPPKYTKEDLEQFVSEKIIINTSITKDEGIGEVEKAIKNIFYSGEVELKDDTIVSNVRHKNQLVKAKTNIEDSIVGINSNLPLDCIEVDLRSCWENLGEISGSTVSEDVLDKIFSEFCIGK